MLRRIPEPAQRRRFFEGIVDGPIGEQVLAGREDDARAAIESALTESRGADAAGEVYLVGAGPGDPDLLTLRALRLMQKADVVVYDRLVSRAVLDLTRRDAERIHAGKQPGYHAIPQHEINDLLARLALDGKRVLRLKGGDPFIFGRGGEEIETLAALGVPFQVVPGITAASGCAAYAGIPLTHREHAQSCIFVTGRRKIGEETLDWDSLVRPNQTVVIYMGLAGLDTICNGLLRHGLAPETPAALIEQGTTSAQAVHTGTVGTLASIVEESRPPGADPDHRRRSRPPAGQAGLVPPAPERGIGLRLPRHGPRLRAGSRAPALRRPTREAAGHVMRPGPGARPQRWKIRSSTAMTAASTRDRTSSFPRIERTWSFTVPPVMPSSRAISLLLCPSARWRSTSSSRGVSDENRSARPGSTFPPLTTLARTLVISGATTVCPSTTAERASTSCSGSMSFRR